MNKRKQNGAALLTVLIMSIASIAFMVALASIVTSAVRVSATNKWAESLRNAAEIGIDYSISQYNSVYPCPLDPTDSSSSLVTMLPASELIANTGGISVDPGIPNLTVSITVKRIIDNTTWDTLSDVSSAYSPQLDNSRSISKGFNFPAETNVKAVGGGYRIVESTATNGTIKRTIRVLLKARFDSNRDDDPPSSTSSAPSPQSYFSQPMFGNSSIEFSSGGLDVVSATGDTAVHAEGTAPNDYKAFDLEMMTNRLASIGSGVHVAGDVQVASNSSGSTPVVSAPGGKVDGRVTSNGEVDPATVTFQDGPAGNLTDAVTASADNPGLPPINRQGLNQSPVVPNSAVNQYQMAPTPSGGGESIPSLASVSQQGTSIDGTSYSTQGLSTSGLTSPVSIDNAAAPTKFFVQDSASNAASSAVDINASLISPSSTDGRNIQIWYEGSKPVNITIPDGSIFRGLIYAPNAVVSISGGSGNATFEGAVVGRTIKSTLHGRMKIYTDLSDVSGSVATNPNLKAGLSYDLSTDGPQIQGWQPISWQEF